MANNGFTETFQDGTTLTQAHLETALQSLKLDVANTSQLTNGSTSGQVLTSIGSGTAASFQAVPDPLGLFAVRNLGLSATASSGALIVSLKTNAGTTPTGVDYVDFTASTNGSTSATYSAVKVTAARSITITASATLGYSNTSTNSVYVYGYVNSSTMRLAIGARSDFERGTSITTTLMSATSDNADTVYATASLTVMPRLLGSIQVAHNTGGLWQTPSKVNLLNLPAVADANTANAIATSTTRATGTGTTTLAVRSVAISNSCGSFVGTNNINAYESVTNLSVSLTTSGRPVVLLITSSTGGSWSKSNTTSTLFRFRRAAAEITNYSLTEVSAGASLLASFHHVDTPPAGTYTFDFQANANGSGQVSMSNCKLVAYEL